MKTTKLAQENKIAADDISDSFAEEKTVAKRRRHSAPAAMKSELTVSSQESTIADWDAGDIEQFDADTAIKVGTTIDASDLASYLRSDATVVNQDNASLASDRKSSCSSLSQNEKLQKQLYYTSEFAHLKENIYWNYYIEMYYTYCDRFDFPEWINPDSITDRQGRRPSDKNFELRRIYIPPNNILSKKVTPALVQFWEHKADNFDSLIFFKLGKFYELFYIDAAIMAKLTGLKWMGNDLKSHVGFPESAINIYAKQLLEKNFRVCIVEQMETPNERSHRSASATTVTRKICQVMTRGSINRSELLSYEACLSLFLHFTDDKLYVLILDVSTCKGQLTTIQLSDNQKIENLCSILLPKEIVVSHEDSLRYKDLITKLRRLCRDPYLSTFKVSETTGVRDAYLSEVLNSENVKVNQELVTFCSELIDDQKVLIELLIKFCSDNLLFDEALPVLLLDYCDEIASSNRAMYLPSSTIQSLRLKEDVMPTINRCLTPCGSRLMYDWLTSPLYEARAINNRRQSVLFLSENFDVSSNIEELFSSLGDIERIFAFYKQLIRKNKRGAVSHVVSGKRHLCRFLINLSKLKSVINLFKHRSDLVFFDQSRSSLYHNQVSQMEQVINEIFSVLVQPNLIEKLMNYDKSLTEKTLSDFSLKKGVNKLLDDCVSNADGIKAEIESLLHDIDTYRSVGLSRVPAERLFIHNKFRYEVEIRETPEFHGAVTSSRRGYIRFHTDQISKLVSTLLEVEESIDLAYYECFYSLVRMLHSHFRTLDVVVTFIKQLDCLFAFSRLLSNERRVYPELVDSEDCNIIELYEAYHPVLYQSIRHYVPNDIMLSNETLILTGPNMGGKSTLSRLVALTVLLNQIGCPVFVRRGSKLSLFDAVFTRINVYDSLLDDLSTFAIELKDVSLMLSKGTRDSLLLLDEFGRGTTAFEGTALAAATVEWICREISCVCFFTTHFHLHEVLSPEKGMITDDLKITYGYMGFENDSSTFKLQKGIYPLSHGLKIGVLAGLPKSIFEQK